MRRARIPAGLDFSSHHDEEAMVITALAIGEGRLKTTNDLGADGPHRLACAVPLAVVLGTAVPLRAAASHQYGGKKGVVKAKFSVAKRERRLLKSKWILYRRESRNMNAAVRNRLEGTPDRGCVNLAFAPAIFVVAQNPVLESI